jgi:4-hydroxythreonine-4-phosphate dehydrogenase
MKKADGSLVKIGISCGDINGVGLEVIMKTFADNRLLQECLPILYCSAKAATLYRKLVNVSDFSFHLIKDPEEAGSKYLNIINCYDEEIRIDFGKENEVAGKLALSSLEAAIKDYKEGKIDALVTAPINKHSIQSESFNFPGHTEFLTQTFQAKESLMVLISEQLRIATLTGHLPLAKVASAITQGRIIEKTKLFNKSLQNDFGIRKPKIALLALNPHAGDGGVIGDEEQKIIIPAIEKLKEEGLLVMGPFPADGFFAAGNYQNFDGVISMYHDQGLIPFKTIAFETGINFTAGLPLVRTSPDHGTAYDIAGKYIASETSFRNAVYLAIDIFCKREQHKILAENPLKINPQRRERQN